MANEAHVQFLQYTVGRRAAGLTPYTVLPLPRLNVLHLVFDPQALRGVFVNWAQVAKAMLDQVQHVAAWARDHAMHELISALLAHPEVPTQWQQPDLERHIGIWWLARYSPRYGSGHTLLPESVGGVRCSK